MGRREKESSAALLSPARVGGGDDLMTKICRKSKLNKDQRALKIH